MRYNDIYEGVFIERPNRFIARVDIGGEEKVCHVKNTGRCRELLTSGTRVILDRSPVRERKTEYDLIAVYKGDTLFNIDSQAPNKVFGEWLRRCDYFGDITLIKPEVTYRNSRFDFYVEAAKRKIFIEVKGVTLERDGVLLFPDAPTERGAKHLSELSEAVDDGYEAYVFFIIQTKSCKYFTPNDQTDPLFAERLRTAAKKGVGICALTCNVTPDSLTVNDFVEIRLDF